MPPKKGKGKKGKKGKKGGGLGNDPDEYKSFNVAERQILQMLFQKVRKNQEMNNKVREDVLNTKKDFRELSENNVSDL